MHCCALASAVQWQDMDETMKKILEIVTETQEDVAEMRKEFRGDISGLQQDVTTMKEDIAFIKVEVRDIRSRLDKLEEQVRGQSGYAKEIDLLMARVSAVEAKGGIKA